jgi:hypothetical protein
MPRVKHVVLLKFKDGTEPAQIDTFYDHLRALKDVIPGIEGFIGGPYTSHEGLNQGYTHGFIVTFKSAAARNGYLPHPEHEKVKNEILPFVAQIVAFDFETE